MENVWQTYIVESLNSYNQWEREFSSKSFDYIVDMAKLVAEREGGAKYTRIVIATESNFLDEYFVDEVLGNAEGFIFKPLE